MKDSLIFAIDSISTHVRKFVLSVLLVFMCSLLVLFTLMVYHGQNLVYESCDYVLARGVKNTGIIQIMDESYFDKIQNYVEQLGQQKEIQVIGDCSEYIEMTPVLEPLWTIQEGNYGFENVEETGLYIENVLRSASNLCEMKLSSGTPIEQLSFEDPSVYYLYLGYGFRDIPIGTTYQVEGDTYQVAGILHSDQSWIKEELLQDFSYEIGNAAQSCDYMVFKIRDKEPPLCDYLWISSAEGYSIDEALAVADQVAEEVGIDIHYSSLQERYEVSQARTILLLQYLSRIIGIVGITALLMLISMQIVFILNNRKEYGIMYAIGYSKRDIFLSTLFYNVIISVVAFVLVLPCLYWIAKRWFSSCGMDYIVAHMFLPYMLPAELFLIGVMLLVVSIVTNGILHIFTPVRMIRSE